MKQDNSAIPLHLFIAEDFVRSFLVIALDTEQRDRQLGEILFQLIITFIPIKIDACEMCIRDRPCSLIPTPPDDEQSPSIFHLQEDFE